MGNQKPKKAIQNAETEKKSEEFFRLPRAEFLIEEVRRNASLSLGDLSQNERLKDDSRTTLLVERVDMQGAGIQPGDYVVIKHQREYQEGDILAVRLGGETLIRRYFRAANRIRLECDPPSRQTIIVETDTPGFAILGRVVQVIREV